MKRSKPTTGKAKPDLRQAAIAAHQAKMASKVKPKTQTKAQIEAELKAQAKAQRVAKATADREAFVREVVAAFKAAGFSNIKPRETVRTWSLWVQEGREPKPGERPVLVKAAWSKGAGYPMFHLSQTRPVPASKAQA
jgi:hypothetical protein